MIRYHSSWTVLTKKHNQPLYLSDGEGEHVRPCCSSSVYGSVDRVGDLRNPAT